MAWRVWNKSDGSPWAEPGSPELLQRIPAPPSETSAPVKLARRMR